MAAAGNLDHARQPAQARAAAHHLGGGVGQHQVRLCSAQAQHRYVDLVVVLPQVIVVRMVGELPADPVVAKLAGDFVCVRLDVDAVPKLCEEYRVRAYPTLILAAPGGVVLQRLTGLQASRDVALEMSAALTSRSPDEAERNPGSAFRRLCDMFVPRLPGLRAARTDRATRLPASIKP